MRLFLDLTKSGITAFVVLSGAIGYFLSWPVHDIWDWPRFWLTISALYFLSAGSFAVNQAQEWRIDAVMPRTLKRPIPSGKISLFQAYVLGFGFIVIGAMAASLVNLHVLVIGMSTVIFYNLIYTLYWKRSWAFGAVPGAIPGALPVVIGYAANSHFLLAPECIYAFLIMFLWQMPHFWSLAIRYKEDYRAGGIPVLPACVGTERTLFHMGLYMFCYVGLAIASPFFTTAYFFYLIVVLPLAFKVLWEFIKYWKAGGEGREWLPFFLWTNMSMLLFLVAPVVDRWHLSSL